MASQNTRLAKLANIISAETKKIQDFLAQNGHPDLGFDVDAPLDFPVSSSNEEIQKARHNVINATQELHDLMVGPREHIRWLAWSFNDNLSLHGVYHFNIAQHVPLAGEVSYAEVAKAAGLDEFNVRRIARHAMTSRIFKEPREGYIAHTAASRLLVEDPLMIDWVGCNCAEFYPASAHTIDAMMKFPRSLEPSETGYTVAKNINWPMFADIGKDPSRAKRFGGAMSSLTGGEGYEVDYMVDGYDWEGLGDGVVVDVGGSLGFVCVALGRKFPRLRFVVQDLPKTVANGPSTIPPELADRIEFQAHDFFTEQPVRNADVYYFRWIFHNWSDKYALKILRSLVPALKPGARIIINDNCLPKPNSVDPWDEKITRTMDMVMLMLLNARERDKDDYASLFHTADPRFKFLGVAQPKGCRMSIVEAVWRPEDQTNGDLANGGLANGDLANGNLANGDLTNGDLANGDFANGDLAVRDWIDGDRTNGDSIEGDRANGGIVNGEQTKSDLNAGANGETTQV